MRWRYTVLALLLIVCVTAALHAEEKNVDSPDNFIKVWVATFNKNAPEKLSAFYDRSKETEVIVSSGVRLQGYKAVQEAYTDDQKHARFYDSKAKQIGSRILGNTALVTFEHMFKIRSLTDDSHWQVHIRTTSVLHRVENEWKIVLEHSSSIRGIERTTRIED